MHDSEKLDMRYKLLKSSANDPHQENTSIEEGKKLDKMDYLIKETGNRLVRIEAKQKAILNGSATKEDLEKAKRFFVFWILFAIVSMPLIGILFKKLIG
ncbi:hypothetical protein AEP_01689 [Curvibacter sp. AEP1-3]|uniref:hypothetical protein n=1 Tax=Curvibacter sp. AEP1-3 TaxID=1844971 RepID=UPI000B3C9771|nr:hypothetical protein [Curvibacter sp. AEP1-3]ARV18633.1 hypothetical protein AEP_01689 [Curvibacter sp. AEP1-3]